MENENGNEVVTVTVAEVIERCIAELAKTNRRIDDVEAVLVMQQDALKDAIATLRAVLEGKRLPRPSVANATTN